MWFAECACRTAFLYGTYSFVKKAKQESHHKKQSKCSVLLIADIRPWTGSWAHGCWVLQCRLCARANRRLLSSCDNQKWFLWGKYCVNCLSSFSSFMTLELPFQLPCHLRDLGHHLNYDRVAHSKLVCHWVIRAMGCKIHQESNLPLEEKLKLWKLEGKVPMISSWQGILAVSSLTNISAPAGPVPPLNR